MDIGMISLILTAIQVVLGLMGYFSQKPKKAVVKVYSRKRNLRWRER